MNNSVATPNRCGWVILEGLMEPGELGAATECRPYNFRLGPLNSYWGWVLYRRAVVAVRISQGVVVVNAPEAGEIRRVLASEGMEIVEGQPIAEIAAPTLPCNARQRRDRIKSRQVLLIIFRQRRQRLNRPGVRWSDMKWKCKG